MFSRSTSLHRGLVSLLLVLTCSAPQANWVGGYSPAKRVLEYVNVGSYEKVTITLEVAKEGEFHVIESLVLIKDDTVLSAPAEVRGMLKHTYLRDAYVVSPRIAETSELYVVLELQTTESHDCVTEFVLGEGPAGLLQFDATTVSTGGIDCNLHETS